MDSYTSLLEGMWASLHTRGTESSGYVRLRISEVNACAAYVAKRISTGLRAFVAEFATSALPRLDGLPQADGVELLVETIRPGRSGRTRLILALTDDQFSDEYTVFIGDVVARLAGATTEREAAAILRETFERWLRFMRLHQTEQFPNEKRVGLIGELLVFKRLIGQSSGTKLLFGWRGCLGSHHDYTFSTGSIEVKTTTSNDAHSMRITSIHQLEPAEDQPLIVAHVHLKATASGSVTLRALATELKSSLSPLESQRFDELLLSCGYHVGLDTADAEPHFELLSGRFFGVDEGFPRLRRDAMPLGVERVTYAVALAACEPFAITKQEAVKRLRLQNGQDGE